MYLVDTSAWIDAQRRAPGKAGHRLQELVRLGGIFGLTPVVLQEILQGVRDEAAFAATRNRLAMQRCYMPVDPIDTYAEAAHLYDRCRWKGVTPRSANDCLIARVAIEHELILLHDDADFLKIARVEPRLRLA